MLYPKGYTVSYTVSKFHTRLLQENTSVSTQAIHINICYESFIIKIQLVKLVTYQAKYTKKANSRNTRHIGGS